MVAGTLQGLLTLQGFKSSPGDLRLASAEVESSSVTHLLAEMSAVFIDDGDMLSAEEAAMLEMTGAIPESCSELF